MCASNPSSVLLRSAAILHQIPNSAHLHRCAMHIPGPASGLKEAAWKAENINSNTNACAPPMENIPALLMRMCSGLACCCQGFAKLRTDSRDATSNNCTCKTASTSALHVKHTGIAMLAAYVSTTVLAAQMPLIISSGRLASRLGFLPALTPSSYNSFLSFSPLSALRHARITASSS